MSAGRRILVVDDDPYTRDLASTALRGQGYEVVGAARFQQGLEAARAQRPHLLLCDVVLPDGSGVDLARALRNEFPEPEVPITILMSAFSKGRLADQRRMKEDAKAVAFLTKPLSLPAVIDLVQQQLPLAAPPAAPAREARPAPREEDPRLSAVAFEPEELEQAGLAASAVTSALPAAPAPAPARAGAAPSSNLTLGLTNAWRTGWTGTLTITRSQVEKTIAVERGQVVWCTTNLTEERLGRIMLRLGFLSRDQYESGLKEAVETRRRLGEVLVQRGHLSQWQLDDALVQQMEAIIQGALGWPEGSYRVVATAGAPAVGDRLVVSPIPRLVVRAFREVTSGDRLDARLRAAGETPVLRRPDVPAAALAQLAPSLEETRFLDALREAGPVSVQLGRHPHGPDAAAPYLAALLALGIVGPDHGARPATPAPSPAARPRAPEPAEAKVRPAEPKAQPPSPARRQAAEAAARRLLEAEAAFEAGRSAVERNDLATAAEQMTLAMTLCPEEGEYRAWAAWINVLVARAAFDATLDAALREMEQAVALTPSAETVQELIEGVTRLRTLSRDLEGR